MIFFQKSLIKMVSSHEKCSLSDFWVVIFVERLIEKWTKYLRPYAEGTVV
jgi:hypothetical protein